MKELREEYGPDAVFTRMGDILIVHEGKPAEGMRLTVQIMDDLCLDVS